MKVSSSSPDIQEATPNTSVATIEFTCTKDNLLRGLSQVAPLAGRNPQLPVLRNILMQFKEGVLHLTCTDLEVGVHTVVPGKVAGEGGVAVPARSLLEYVQQLPATHPLVLQISEAGMKVSTEGFTARFSVMSDDDFPLLPAPSQEQAVTLPAELFCQAIQSVIFAAAREVTRPELHSVYIWVGSGELRVAAADGFRLAEMKASLEGGEDVSDDFSLLLPLATAQEVVRLFSKEKELALFPQEGHVAIHGGEGVEFTSRLVEGAYPDYQHIIPTDFKAEGVVSRDDFLRALKTLSVFLPRDSRRIQLTVQPKQGQIVFRVGSGDSGEGMVQVAFDGSGEELEVLFNIQYLLDGLHAIKTEQVRLRFVDTAGPAVIDPVASEKGYVYVVMPIQA